MDRRALGAAVVRGDAEDERFFVLFRDLDLDVEVASVVENAGVDQLEFRLAEAAAVFVK